MSEHAPEDTPRWGLLPNGCRNLLDVIRWEERQRNEQEGLRLAAEAAMLSKALPPLPEMIEIGSFVTVKELAAKLGRPPFKIIAMLINMDIFVANSDKIIGYEVAEQIAASYGVKAYRLP